MELNKQNTKKILGIILAAVLMVCAAVYFSEILAILKKIFSVLAPFIFGFCLAFVLNLILRPLEKLWARIWKKARRQELVRRTSRPVCLVLSIVLLLAFLFAVCFIVLPRLVETILDFVQRLPAALADLEAWWLSLQDSLDRFGIVLPQFSLGQQNTDMLDRLLDIVKNGGQALLDTTVNVTSAIASAVVDIVVGFVFSVYLLAGKERLKAQVKKLVSATLPETSAQTLFAFTGRANVTFTSFVTGQLTEAFILGMLCFIGMLIFGFPYASVISVLIGTMALIPIFGAFIGTVIGALLILAVAPIKALWFVVFILILQQIEGNVIYPHVVGKSVGLPGIWVLFAVTIGGSIFGVLGMLLAVPVFSIVYVLLREFAARRTKETE